jgi:hypothetical protein
LSNSQTKQIMQRLNGKVTMLGIIMFMCLSVSVWAQKKDDKRNGKEYHGRHGHHSGHRGGGYRSGTLAEKINHITQADSIQAKKMKPIVDKASVRLKVLRDDFHKKEKVVMDSLNLQLKPLLKDDQKKRLDDFSERKTRGEKSCKK